MTNIIEGIQEECRRVREQLLPAYADIGPAGAFGSLMLKQSVARGEAAIASGDAVEMVRALEDLRGCQ